MGEREVAAELEMVQRDGVTLSPLTMTATMERLRRRGALRARRKKSRTETDVETACTVPGL